MRSGQNKLWFSCMYRGKLLLEIQIGNKISIVAPDLATKPPKFLSLLEENMAEFWVESSPSQ